MNKASKALIAVVLLPMLFSGCFREENPNISSLLNLATAESQYNDLYQQMIAGKKPRGVTITKEETGLLPMPSASTAPNMVYNPKVPGVSTYASTITVDARGRECSYHTVFYFSATNSIIAVEYNRIYRHYPPLAAPVYWSPKW